MGEGRRERLLLEIIQYNYIYMSSNYMSVCVYL